MNEFMTCKQWLRMMNFKTETSKILNFNLSKKEGQVARLIVEFLDEKGNVLTKEYRIDPMTGGWCNQVD